MPMTHAEKLATLDAIEKASTERLRKALTQILCIYHSVAVDAEERFGELTPLRMGEAICALEVTEVLAGAVSPCAEVFCDRGSHLCKVHKQKPPPKIPVRYSLGDGIGRTSR